MVDYGVIGKGEWLIIIIIIDNGVGGKYWVVFGVNLLVVFGWNHGEFQKGERGCHDLSLVHKNIGETERDVIEKDQKMLDFFR